MYWHSLYNKRFAWAERAYETFLLELDPELSKAFKREKEISIVLFGPTQVGKTTLLLTLMGISPAHFDQVATVLRGEQKKGYSATAMPTYYDISPDDYWYISATTGKGLSDNDITTSLSDLRCKVEGGDMNNEKIEPYRIFIPQCYFNNISNDFRTRILDLPGVMAANTHERELVTQISEKYVPTADLVLMVAKADDMSFLHPENIAIPEVADWVFTPNRFRLIFTHTFSSASFRDEFSNNLQSTDDVSSYFLEQLQTHIPGLDVNKEQIYPLEYGLSYDGMKNGNDGYFEKVERITLELFDRLKNDITKSGTKENRIRAALDVHVVAERKKKEFVRDKETYRTKLKKDLSILSEKYNVLDNGIKAEEEARDSLEPEINEACYKSSLLIVEEVLEVRKAISIDDETVDSVRSFITNCKVDFREKCNSLVSKLEVEGIFVDINPTYKGFVKLERRLEDYIFSSTYYPKITDNFKKDKETAFLERKNMFKPEVVKTKNDIDFLYKASEAKHKKNQVDGKAMISFLKNKKTIYDVDIKRIDIEIIEIDNSIRDFEQRMVGSSSNSSKFKGYLDVEYARESVRIKEIVSNDDGIKKFYSLCYAKLVSVLYSNLMRLESAKQ